MSIAHARIDRFISEKLKISRRAIRLMLAQKRIIVDGQHVTDIGQIIHRFSHIVVDNKIIQAEHPTYLMLHKPIGVVSATIDKKHQTVIDLLPQTNKASLHIVGRLDLNTSGLLLLTDDSRWSERLMSPDHKVAKQYLVTLANPLTPEYVEAFANGMYFEYEDITTLPAKLTIISTFQCEVTLFEGKYHQIKRMFGRFQNPVVALHRQSIGHLTLPNDLAVGEYRALTPVEVCEIFNDKT